MEVKSTFLNGELEEEVYIEQPKGFLLFDKEDYVCRLKKALYHLKQAPELGMLILMDIYINKDSKKEAPTPISM